MYLSEKSYKSVEEEKEDLKRRLKELEDREKNSIKDQMDRAIKVRVQRLTTSVVDPNDFDWI